MNKMQNTFPEDFALGLRAFNQQAFYEAHEHFEDAWRLCTSEEREIFRAFLHLSGGFYRLTQNRPGAARKFFTHAQKWLAGFPARFHGLDLAQIMAFIQQLIEEIDDETPSDVIFQVNFKPIQLTEGPKQ
jgi:predicted metal-dependent hydrolase